MIDQYQRKFSPFIIQKNSLNIRSLNRDWYEELKLTLVQFEFGFELMPGTGDHGLSAKRTPFQQDPPVSNAGG